MKFAKILSISLMLAMISCKCNQKTTESEPVANNDQPLSIKIPDQINIGKHLRIEVTTNLKEGVILYDPALIRIERSVKEEWKQVQILHCPCGANCMPPPKKDLITIEKPWSKSWNLTESWCVDIKGSDIPETKEQAVNPGKYRTVFYYSTDEKDRIKITKEFEVIN